jgi:methyl-accepting chemotaxis protein
MKSKSYRSTQIKFLMWVIPTIVVTLSILAIILYQFEKGKKLESIEKTSIQIVQGRSSEIEKWLNSLVLELQQLSYRRDVKSLNWNEMQADLKVIANKRKDIYNFIAVGLPSGDFYTTLQGKSNLSIKDKDFYKAIFEENKDFVISNPYYSLTTKMPSFSINTAIRNDKGEVIGSIGGIIYLTTLSKIAQNIKIDDIGYGWLIDNQGVCFAHPDTSLIFKLNVLKSSEAGFVNLDKVGEKMIKSKFGSGIVKDPQNNEKVVFFSRIPLSPNWSLGLTLPSSHLYSEVNDLLLNLLFSFILTLIILSVLIWILTKEIINKPLLTLIRFTDSLSKGQLYKVIRIKSNDDVGAMAQSISAMAEKLKEITNSIKEGANNIASGSNQLSSGTSQIAEGAAMQAAAAEEVSASVEEMAASISMNAENAQITENIALKAVEDIQNVVELAHETVKAIKLITDKIAIVNEISGKTDLLAINAAVEAARAGEYGKGFAVVASEVRKLAEHSKRSSVEINQVSTATISIAEKFNAVLNDVIPSIKKNADLVREIRSASSEQNTGVDQINNAVQQLAQITQQNAASAEEMASNTEELAQQANLLNETMAFFRLTSEDENVNIKSILLKRMMDTIKLIENSDDVMQDKKIVIDISDIDLLKNKTKKKKGNSGVDINLDKESIDNNYEVIE